VAVRDVPGSPAPERFGRAVQTLRSARLRSEVVITEVPAPQRIAPHAAALSADVVAGGEELATGRFVLLHDPAGQEAWEGSFRAVTFARATLEPEMGADPLLGQVGWSWLEECLDGAGARVCAAGGTVTRVVSESFAGLAERPATVEIEIRASWTPLDDDLAPHLRGWADLLCTVAGLPPVPEGVASLPRRLR
jgi:hypothetical protein